jgi:thymidylate synthase
MNNADLEYFRIANKILADGVWKENRTGMDCLTVAGAMFEHDMSDGFPLLTSRKLPFKSTKVELEFFIKGLRSKKWLQDRGCNYWNQWCNPKKVAYGHDVETQAKMAAEDDLGLVYGTQWRDFRDPEAPEGSGIDQLKNVVDKLKSNPQDRRLLVSAWNPLAITHAALPSCHDGFRLSVIKNRLNLAWTQRSVDFYLGFPANLASYAMLLHLLAKECNLQEGKLIGFLWDTHLYQNHIPQTREILSRRTYALPTVETEKFTSIFDWEHQDSKLLNYECGPALFAEVSI